MQKQGARRAKDVDFSGQSAARRRRRIWEGYSRASFADFASFARNLFLSANKGLLEFLSSQFFLRRGRYGGAVSPWKSPLSVRKGWSSESMGLGM